MLQSRKTCNVILIISSFIIAFIIYNKALVINDVRKGLNTHMDKKQLTEPDNEHVGRLSRNVTSSDNHKRLDTQRSRISTINAVCEANPNIRSVDQTLQGIVYISGPLYYCNVPKLGSEFLKAFFPMGLQSIGKDAAEEEVSTEVFSYINVGDPYERLYSGYKDKLFKPNMDFWPTLGKRILNTVRPNKNKKIPCSGCDVTFREIVEYVIYHHEQGLKLNLHFEPIHKQCNPCERRFDFVSRKETMSDDIVDLFDTLKERDIVKDEVSVPTLENGIRYKQKFSEGSVRKVFEATTKFPSMSAYKLFQRHWSTYHIGGYILNQYELPYSESEVKTITQTQYESAISKAMDKSRDQREQLKLQRHEAIVEAYRSIPTSLLPRLRAFVKTDCMLFSYDDKPDFIFNRDTNNYAITHTYMKGL